MRVLVMTKIFPNSVEPLSSPFNRQQFAELARLCDVEVLATIPWFPGARAFAGASAAGRLTSVPAREVIDGLDVAHPRFLFLPRFGRPLLGALYSASLLPALVRRRRAVDVLLGSWAYPDGFATVALGRLLGLPTVVKLHGSDLHVVARMPGLAPLVRWTLANADRVIAVSKDLREEAVKLGARSDRVDVVMNGIDASLFFPAEQSAARRELGLADAAKWILYVGRLAEDKGMLDLLDAFLAMAARRPEVRLAIVGDGPLRAQCEMAALKCRPGQLRVFGARPIAEVPRFLASCDVFTLPSWNEGTPNVLLEARACGRPSVATRVGGIPDVITEPVLGELVAPREPAALGAALERVLDGAVAGRHPPSAIAARGSRAGWKESAQHVHSLLTRAVSERAA